jgi:hypothetical protein
MGFLSRLAHREQPQDVPCPRCGVLAPASSTQCSACGWDLRDAYHDPLAEPATPAAARDSRE